MTADTLSEMAAALTLDEAEVASLIEQAEGDPLAGCPLTWTENGQRVDLEPGGWHGHADRFTRLPPGCPVTPLGFEGELFYFLNPIGQVATLKASSSGKGPIGALFAGRSRYLEWAWPRWDRSHKQVVGWEADDARQALMDACAYVGSFEDADMVRGRGAWADAAGGIVYHSGDRVLSGGRWARPGRAGRWVYAARPALDLPEKFPVEAGADGPAQLLRDVYASWNWRRPEIDAQLLLGWTCMAMIGGALDWRSMVFVTAEKGSGKSTLQKVLAAVLGRGLVQTVDATGPGLYQKLRHDCMPVLIDELEPGPRATSIIELIRKASSGGKINRGSSEGQSREYECRSAFICSSIDVPAMKGQDQRRFAVLFVDKFKEAKADVSFDLVSIAHWGRQLMRRMLDGWPRWQKTLLAFRKALIEQGRHEAGGADQFGALLTAAWIAENDEEPDAETLTRWAGLLQASAMTETSESEEGWRDCLGAMTSVIPEAYRMKTTRLPTLGARIAAFRDGRVTEGTAGGLIDLEEMCRQVGLALSFPKGKPETFENARLFIPAKGPEVRKLFAGTQWQGDPGATGVWHTTLQRAPQDMIQRGQCIKGYAVKTHGLYVDLAKAFPREDEGVAD